MRYSMKQTSSSLSLACMAVLLALAVACGGVDSSEIEGTWIAPSLSEYQITSGGKLTLTEMGSSSTFDLTKKADKTYVFTYIDTEVTLTLQGDGSIKESGLGNGVLHKKGSAGAKDAAEKKKALEENLWEED